MGMYTECFIRVELISDLPENVSDVLKAMFITFNAEKIDKEKLPNHKFFTLDRWTSIGCGSSCYHIPFSTSEMKLKQGKWYIISRSDLKNYDNEIHEFFDFIKPYVNSYDQEFIGYSMYEESRDQPRFYYTDK